MPEGRSAHGLREFEPAGLDLAADPHHHGGRIDARVATASRTHDSTREQSRREIARNPRDRLVFNDLFGTVRAQNDGVTRPQFDGEDIELARVGVTVFDRLGEFMVDGQLMTAFAADQIGAAVAPVPDDPELPLRQQLRFIKIIENAKMAILYLFMAFLVTLKPSPVNFMI